MEVFTIKRGVYKTVLIKKSYTLYGKNMTERIYVKMIPEISYKQDHE